MMHETNQEVMAAARSIEDGSVYAIYTETTATNGKKQPMRHYLRADGYLSDSLTDSCQFVLHRQEGEALYRQVAFHVCYHDKIR